MSEAPAVAASRPRDPGLFGSFDLPAAWGCRRPMAFCRDLHAAALVGSEPAAAAAAAAAAVEPKRNASRSPPKGGDAPVAAAAATAQEAPRKQWNLRYRKGGRDSGEDAQQNKKLWNMEAGGGGGGGGSARASRGFSVELTRQEIDADFFAITGRKAPRKPAKRPRNVQRQVDSICPGNSLWEVSRDRYKVNDFCCR
uniref:Uncharacterized protein n=1 Tax=Oryza punctata TaxID=4537 RepID=A0A0E0L5E7_ORYPU